MCREIVWKRIVPFFLSFFLGFIVVTFLALQEIPSVEVEEEITSILEVIESDNETKGSNLRSEKLNCVPTDPNLKYTKLNSHVIKPEKKENSTQTKVSKPETLQESIEEIEKQIRETSDDYKINHNLLYKEYCFESNGRK